MLSKSWKNKFDKPAVTMSRRSKSDFISSPMFCIEFNEEATCEKTIMKS